VEDAINCSEKVIGMDPKDPTAWKSMAGSLKAAGIWDAAAQAMAR